MMRINDFKYKATLKAAALVAAILLLSAGVSFGQQGVNLTAGPNTTSLPDGTVVPMWGYTCGAAVTGSTATCAPLSGANPLYYPAAAGALGGIYIINGGSGYAAAPTITISAPTGVIPGVTNVTATATAVISGGQVVSVYLTNPGAGYIAAPTITLSSGNAVLAASPAWSPVLITVPYGAGGLVINLTNNLSFTVAGTTTVASSIPTSIVIPGQVGGGLGVPGVPTTTMSPSHANTQACATWFIASGATPPSTACPGPQTGSGTPPTQANRVQSMAQEVTAGATTATPLTWANLKPGTYLLESGTHPSIQVPMGLIGMLVVTTAPSGATPGTAYPAGAATAIAAALPAVQYNAEVPLEFSEIDPVQNKEVDVAVRTAGFSETMVWSGLPINQNTGQPGCGNPSSTTYHQCYPPAVNYTPFYFLINGVAFDKDTTNRGPLQSLFAATAGVTGTPPTSVTTGITGTILVRLVNAGLFMHVPSIVGSQTTGFNGAGGSATVAGFTLIAEDGNLVPNSAPTGSAHPA